MNTIEAIDTIVIDKNPPPIDDEIIVVMKKREKKTSHDMSTLMTEYKSLFKEVERLKARIDALELQRSEEYSGTL